MRKFSILSFIALLWILIFSSSSTQKQDYQLLYQNKISTFKNDVLELNSIIQNLDSQQLKSNLIVKKLNQLRFDLKATDFWLRYLNPNIYRKINSVVDVEWENEVFEKFENPYRRQGFGIYLFEKEIWNKNPSKKYLIKQLDSLLNGLQSYHYDSVKILLNNPSHFYLANRLYLLNLAAIYSTGYECQNINLIIPELKFLVQNTNSIYENFNQSNPDFQIEKNYLTTYKNLIDFVNLQTNKYDSFNHFEFIKNYVNVLYSQNQQMILKYHVIGLNTNDYTLNNNVNSIFSKQIYQGQNAKGIYNSINDSVTLNKIKTIGKLLFNDPILSGNNQRSCASCHKPNQYFTDTTKTQALSFSKNESLKRNTPSLINVVFNHLLMMDGKHYSLHYQAIDVLTNPIEMHAKENEIVKKVMSCKIYNAFFKEMKTKISSKQKIGIDDIISTLTIYYSQFSYYSSAFDNAMNNKNQLNKNEIAGFNLFMSKAQCATCHFVPIFNGVKPPFINSEFEIIGVPNDTNYSKISDDIGRNNIIKSDETNHAFRTPTLRNFSFTKPYMHNGIFINFNQIINLYNHGGGKGKGLQIDNQTLSSDSLHLSTTEINQIEAFIKTLNENIAFEKIPTTLPNSINKKLNSRIVGGNY